MPSQLGHCLPRDKWRLGPSYPAPSQEGRQLAPLCLYQVTTCQDDILAPCSLDLHKPAIRLRYGMNMHVPVYRVKAFVSNARGKRDMRVASPDLFPNYCAASPLVSRTVNSTVLLMPAFLAASSRFGSSISKFVPVPENLPSMICSCELALSWWAASASTRHSRRFIASI